MRRFVILFSFKVIVGAKPLGCSALAGTRSIRCAVIRRRRVVGARGLLCAPIWMHFETVNTLESTHDIYAFVLGRAQTGISAFANYEP